MFVYCADLSKSSPKYKDFAFRQEGEESAPHKAANHSGIFEEIALKRLKTDYNISDPIFLLPLPVKLSVLIAVGLSFLGLLWAVLARVPVQVNGMAVLIPEDGIRGLYAETSGTLRWQVSGIGINTLDADSRLTNKKLQDFWIDEYKSSSGKLLDSQELSQLIRGALRSNQGQNVVLPSLTSQKKLGESLATENLVEYSAATVLAHIVDPTSYQELNGALLTNEPQANFDLTRVDESVQSAQEYEVLAELTKKQLEIISAELDNRRELYERYVRLWRQGAISYDNVLEQQSVINQLSDQLLQNKISIANSDISRRNQVSQSRQARINSIENRSALENGLIRFLEKTTIFAPSGGFFLLALNFPNNTEIKLGDEILSYTQRPPSLPSEIPIFLDANTAQQVNEGMQILMTPKGISRAQFGGIQGEVVEVNKLPLLGDSLLGLIGSRAIVASIEQSYPSPYLARVRLIQDDPKHCQKALSYQCYKWSSNRLPPHPVRLASMGDLQITTEYKRPIEFVMPALRRWFGLVVENQ